MPLRLQSFPRAIIHIDGDSFFASCEVAMNPKLRGKPVVTGRERGIASSMSYEAKARGVKRGMILSEIKKICPEVIILPSDYETYSLFSKRMYEIVRRYTPEVDEYSIDECFADLTGLRRSLRMSYENIASKIKHDLDTELGMTFSIGLAPNKVLAKVGSNWKKPSGLTVIPGYKIEKYLKDLPVSKIWGIGRQTSAFLNKYGIRTALEYTQRSKDWIDHNLSKPYQGIWRELRGEFIYPLNTEAKDNYQSISKTKTFTPPSIDRNFVFSQLSKNIENACIKARRHELLTNKIFFFLKTQEFRYHGLELSFATPINIPNEIISLVKENFNEVYRPTVPYRATGIVLMNLEKRTSLQMDLFGKTIELSSWRRVYDAVDLLDSKFGKHSVFLGTTLQSLKGGAHQNERGDTPVRLNFTFKGENQRQRVGIPMLGEVK